MTAEPAPATASTPLPSPPAEPSGKLPHVTITYCTQCQWLLRAGWMAQELLSTFGTDLGAVTLVPGTGGVFTIDCDGAAIWDRRVDGGFPDVKTLKQRIRDRIAPGRDLGHVDR
ncbi:MAG: SelT/SelW/SelH family protein [Lautropia sp.]